MTAGCFIRAAIIAYVALSLGGVSLAAPGYLLVRVLGLVFLGRPGDG